MKKPALLRAAIAALMPELARDPDRLAMWVERGQVRAPGNRQHGFSWEYELILYAENFTRDPAMLFFIVVEWLRTQQPDLLAANAQGFPFEVDVIDDKTADIKITLPLREVITASDQGAGQWELTVCDEQTSLFPDDEPLCPHAGQIVSIMVPGSGPSIQAAP